jgi:hypothetical protein
MKKNLISACSSNPAYGIAVLAMLLGGLLYLLCRPACTRVTGWIQDTGFWSMLRVIRESLAPVCVTFPAWVLYSLPDGLWSFAYAVIMSQLWRGRSGLISRLWLSTIPMVGIGFELSQLLAVIPGTFTWLDLFFSSVGMVLGLKMRLQAPLRNARIFR